MVQKDEADFNLWKINLITLNSMKFQNSLELQIETEGKISTVIDSMH